MTRRQFVRFAGVASGAVLLAGPRAFAATTADSVLDLDPGPDNPRNSEGAFVTLKSGRILFVYTRFYGGTDVPTTTAGPGDGNTKWRSRISLVPT